MKAPLLFYAASFCFFSFSSFAQAPGDWEFVSQAGGSTSDVARSIVTDAGGNSYVAGYYDGSATFVGTSTITLNSAGGNDIFVAKYDPAGSCLWAVSAGGSGTDQAIGVALDYTGAVYVTGNFSLTATFNGTTPVNLTSNGQSDLFVAKYDMNGDLLWARRAGGSGADYGNKIEADFAGNTYLTGYFASDTLLFYGTVNDTLFTNGQNDILFARLDANGDVAWARSAGGSGNDNGNGIAVDGNGIVYLTGTFLNTAYFYKTVGKDSLVSQGSNDVFTAVFDPMGDLLWVRQGGSTLTDIGSNITFDGWANVYVVGNCSNNCTFFSPLNGSITVTSNGSSDVFLICYDSFGNLKWAKTAGGAGAEFGSGLVLTTNNHLAITGGIGTGTSTFYGTITNISLNNAGSTDVFVAEYDTLGFVLCAQAGGGTGFDRGWEISADAAGDSYIAGQFAGTAIFPATPSFTLTSNGGTSSDALVAKWKSSCSGTTGVSLAKQSLLLYPNPAANEITLESTVPAGEIVILNMLGERVLVTKMQSPLQRISLRELPAGLYVLSTREGAVRFSKQ
jgi:hypothetical protein